jgi:hypothetical protein
MGHVQAPLQFLQYSVYELHEQVRAISELLQCIVERQKVERKRGEGGRRERRERLGTGRRWESLMEEQSTEEWEAASSDS